MGHYENKLPSLLMELESGGYSGVATILSLYGFPHPERDTEKGDGKRRKVESADMGMQADPRLQLQRHAGPDYGGAGVSHAPPPVPARTMGHQGVFMKEPSQAALPMGSMSMHGQSGMAQGHNHIVLKGMNQGALMAIAESYGAMVPARIIFKLGGLAPDEASGKNMVELASNYMVGTISRKSLVDYYELLLEYANGGHKPSNLGRLMEDFEMALNEFEMAMGMVPAGAAASPGRSLADVKALSLEYQFGFGGTHSRSGAPYAKQQGLAHKTSVFASGLGG